MQDSLPQEAKLNLRPEGPVGISWQKEEEKEEGRERTIMFQAEMTAEKEADR